MKTTRRALVRCLTLILAGVLAQAGCRGPSRGTPQNTYVGGEGRETEIDAMNRELQRALQIVNVRSRRVGERLQVQFDLENQRSTNLAFEWAVDWQDDSGFKIDFPQRWQPQVIGGGGRETFSITGPTPAASVWRLKIRTPNTIR